VSLFAKRLKEARLRANVSQEKLGVLAGFDEMSASARMNQYETGKHVPVFSDAQRIAKALNVPAAYFYAEGDTATLLLIFHRLGKTARAQLMQAAKNLE
jgi:transcriptional regulator with XRE-family HTH domain